MKTISLRIFGALLVLGVLWVIVPGVRAEDPIDRLNETGQYQAELFQETVQQYQDLRTSADEMNSMWQDTPPAPPMAGLVAVPQVKLQAVPQDPVAFAQMVRQNQERARQQILQGQQQLLQQAGRAAPQAVPPPQPMPLDPVAFQQMVRQNQEKVRQQILQTQQQILQRRQEIIQQLQIMGLPQ